MRQNVVAPKNTVVKSVQMKDLDGITQVTMIV